MNQPTHTQGQTIPDPRCFKPGDIVYLTRDHTYTPPYATADRPTHTHRAGEAFKVICDHGIHKHSGHDGGIVAENTVGAARTHHFQRDMLTRVKP